MTKKEILRRMSRLLRPYLPLMLLSLLLSAGLVAANLLIPVLTGDAIDLIVGPGRVDLAGLRVIGLRILIAAGAGALCQWLAGVLNNRIGACAVTDLRVAAFTRLQRLPLSYLDGISSGELLSRVITDVDQFQSGLLMGFSQAFSGVLTILGTLVLMLRTNYRIALAVILLTPLSLFVASFISRRSYRLFRAQAEARGRLSALSEELMSGGRVIRAFGQEAAGEARFEALNLALAETGRRAVFYSSLTNPCTRFVNNLIYAVVALMSAFACLGGGFTVGAMSCFLTYANRYAKPFNEISGLMAELANALSCLGRVFELTEQPPEEPDPEDAEELPRCEGAVTLDRVSFSYLPEKPLIEDLSLEVRPGQRIAIVGPTGCGKTTLINLLMRFYEVRGGEIRLDGIPVRRLTRAGLRACYGMVLQDSFLKSGTVRENIAYGREDAAEEEILEAARRSHAAGFIRRLPKGLDTEIGEDGGGLSQGQKQLICIARAMLTNPEVLILDEATSSIDTLTEQRVQQAFAEMMKGRTSFVVAHRLSTVREADLILVMRDGRVIERGRHEELLAQNGFYRELYESQLAINQ